MKEKHQKFVRRALNVRYNDITWSNLDENSFNSSNETFYSIGKIFDAWNMERIKSAFDNKQNILVSECNPKRDYSVETKLGEDGVFRAWFSSEFSGSGNGSYYLLMNPTTAVHYEND